MAHIGTVSGPHPNPWGREYTSEEWRAAQSIWPQYRDARERSRGPLIYASPENLLRQVREAVAKTAKLLAAQRVVLMAVERETEDGAS